MKRRKFTPPDSDAQMLADIRELLLIIARSLPPQDNDLVTEFMERRTHD